MKQPFLLEFLRTYPTKRIAKKLLERESVILTHAELVSPVALVSVLDHIRKLAFDPLIVVSANNKANMRASVQDCLLRAEKLAGETNLPIYNSDLYKNGIVPCIESTETGWTTSCDINTIKLLMANNNVNKVYRFRETALQSDMKRFIQKQSEDTLTNLLLKDDSYKSTVVDVPFGLPGEMLRHCTNGKLNSGVEYRRGISVIENKYNSASLKSLLENSFSKKFKNWGKYEQDLNNSSVYVAGNYFGTAIVHNLTNNVSYLDKFAVDVNQQSSGVAELLWSHLKSHHNTLAWRSRSDNPANSWYLARSDGSFSLNEKWKLFWYGTMDFDHSDSLHKLIDNIPSTFSEENFSK